jgi:hypothetical protein
MKLFIFGCGIATCNMMNIFRLLCGAKLGDAKAEADREQKLAIV